MKTTREIIELFESIGHDPQNNDFLNKKWFSEEEFEKRVRKFCDFINKLEEQSDNWDKLCDCPASENPMNHKKNCMTIKIRRDISGLEL